jgi:ribosome-associated heat shock protein Hsp15
MSESSEKMIRLDKWLKISRLIRARTKASEACGQGRVKVNDQVAKASKLVKIGDTISIRFRERTRTFDVLDIQQKNVKIADAALLYHEHEMTPEEKEAEDIRNLFYQATRLQRPKFKGRPTKKDRRELDKLRGQEE